MSSSKSLQRKKSNLEVGKENLSKVSSRSKSIDRQTVTLKCEKSSKYNQSFLNDWVQKTSIVPNSEPIVLKKKKKEPAIPQSLLKLISKTVPKFGRSLNQTVPLRSRPSSAAQFIESRSTPTPTPTPTPQNIVKKNSSVTVSFDAKINKKGQNQRADRPCPLSKKPKSVSASSTSGSSVKSPAAELNSSTASSRIPIYDRNCSASRLTDEDDLKSSKTKTSSSSSSDSVNLHLARLISLMTCKKCKRILRPNRIVKCLNCHFYCKECKGGKDENSFGDYCKHCRERRKIRPSKPLSETHLQLEAADAFIEKCGLCSDKYYNLGNGKIEHLAYYCRKTPKNFVFRSA